MIKILLKGDSFSHYGVSVKDGAPGRGSGRYPLGSGENPRSINNGNLPKTRGDGKNPNLKNNNSVENESIRDMIRTELKPLTDEFSNMRKIINAAKWTFKWQHKRPRNADTVQLGRDECLKNIQDYNSVDGGFLPDTHEPVKHGEIDGHIFDIRSKSLLKDGKTGLYLKKTKPGKGEYDEYSDSVDAYLDDKYSNDKMLHPRLNPGFSIDKHRNANCYSCAIAMELDKRGYEVMAKRNQGAMFHESQYAFKTKEGPRVHSGTKKMLESLIADGVGSRGILNIYYKFGLGGHALYYEVVKDSSKKTAVQIYDPQATTMPIGKFKLSDSKKGYSVDTDFLGLYDIVMKHNPIATSRLDNAEVDPENIHCYVE